MFGRTRGINLELRTEDGEHGRVAEPLAGNVLRDARVVAHVGESRLGDQQVPLAAHDEARRGRLLARLDGHAVAQPSDLRRRDAFRRQAAQLHLPLQLDAPRIRVLGEVLPQDCISTKPKLPLASLQ